MNGLQYKQHMVILPLALAILDLSARINKKSHIAVAVVEYIVDRASASTHTIQCPKRHGKISHHRQCVSCPGRLKWYCELNTFKVLALNEIYDDTHTEHKYMYHD